MMKKLITLTLASILAIGINAKPKAAPSLQFTPQNGEARVMTMHDGSQVRYTAHEGMFFVTNIEDSTYQTINVYVPDGATQQTPIFLRTYVGGYMASAAGRPQATDTQGVVGQAASGENEEFGDASGSSVNFTPFSAGKNGTKVTSDISRNVTLLNPMNFIDDPLSSVAPHWYIRHGARDRDTAFPIPINLALKLQNAGKDVNFLLAWNRPHSGDYALDELFQWLRNIIKD